MKKTVAVLLAVLLVLSLTACSKTEVQTVFDRIRGSAAAELELPDGTTKRVDGEIQTLRSFADLRLRESTMEPADGEGDWTYRIVFDPAGSVQGRDPVVVSFHQDYVQIGEEFYLPENGVDYGSILDWARSKFDYFMK